MAARPTGRAALLGLALVLIADASAADVLDRIGNALDRAGAYVGRKLGVDQDADARSAPDSRAPFLIEESRPPTIAAADRDAAAGKLRDGLARQARAATDTDRDAASALIVEAAELGDPDAQYLLGVGYRLRPEAERDMARAALWLARAASQGHERAQYALAQAYIGGDGVRRDPAWANMWLERAARRGHGPAQRALALRQIAGEGGPANEPEAYRWLAIAAAAGEPDVGRYHDALGKRFEPGQRQALDDEAAAFRPVVGAEPWPDVALVRYVQATLAARGFDPGPADGVWGRRTRAALARYAGGDGGLSPTIVARLRAA